MKRPFEGADINALVARGKQMHLDATFLFIPAHFVRERSQIEIGVEFSVYSAENIQIECGCHSGWIVISRQHRIDILHKVCTEQEEISSAKVKLQARQKFDDILSFQIADGAAKKKKKKRMLVRSFTRDLCQAVHPIAANTFDFANIPKLSFAGIKSST